MIWKRRLWEARQLNRRVFAAIIGANAVNLIQAQAGLTNTAQIPANQIQQPPATPPPAS